MKRRVGGPDTGMPVLRYADVKTWLLTAHGELSLGIRCASVHQSIWSSNIFYVNMQKILQTRAGLDTVPPNLSPSITGLTLEGNQIAYVGNMEMYIR